MKHIFLVNPAAGGGKTQQDLPERIRTVCEERGVDYHIHTTTGVGDATETARALCEQARSNAEPIRLYACGGDGTLSEVLVGMADCPHAELGLIPCGTGNDFVRNFTPADCFSDIAAQLDGAAVPIDLLMANGTPCLNMINIGFDCEVVTEKERFGRKPHFPNKLAYIAGVATTFFRMPGISARISIDGGEFEPLALQLTTMANGEYCGGGFHSNPRSLLQDGLIDILQISPVSRFTFLRLIGSYKAGTHLDGDKNAAILKAFKCRTVDIEFDNDQNVCIDGEVQVLRQLHLEVAPGSVRFAIPAGAALRRADVHPMHDEVTV